MAAAVRVLSEETPRKGLVRLLPFLGPAFIASIAYVDPGNFATNIQGGAQFGYTLLWVIVGSNLMAMLVQALSAKLGIATGHNLAELCRLHVPAPATWFLWGLMEIVAMATDLAEFLGAAIGFNLLFGIPLWVAAILTAVATFGVLSLEHKGFRPLEAVITALVGVIAVCYLIETVLDRPDWGQVAFHSVVPQFRGRESLILAAGILGATVMPHVIFLHSALLQGRVVVRDPVRLRRLFRFETTDVILAGFDPTRTLVISQVVLSFGLPFAVVPLILFTRRKDIMGVLVNRPSTTALASLVAALIVALNLY
jgi:manganese transport protein